MINTCKEKADVKNITSAFVIIDVVFAQAVG
jgi:hypothetical protein